MWIPAFAGMTVEGGNDGYSGADAGFGKDFWIPAFAGMTALGAGILPTERYLF